MAHYLAEVIVRAEGATGDDRIVAQRECFEIILQLWKHRATLPGPKRPLGSFEPVFRTLERLADHNRLVYFERTEHMSNPEFDEWLDLAAGIDHAARDLIRWCIATATSEAAIKEGKWMESDTARALDDGPDLGAARMLFENMKIIFGSGEDSSSRQVDELSEMRKHLDELISLSRKVRGQIDRMLRE
jgi:hypothetical protein